MNCIVIVSDTFRYDYLGANGNAWIKTPARDASASLLMSQRWDQSLTDLRHPGSSDSLIPLFEGMVGLLKKSRAEAFGSLPAAAEPKLPTEAPALVKPQAPPKEPERMRMVRAEETKRTPVVPTLKDHVLVHVLEDIPPFAGIDTTYRLKKEDVVTLPKTIAKILVDRGKARIVQASGVSLAT